MNLDRKIVNLRAQRVRLRKSIQAAPWAIPDAIDCNRHIDQCRAVLRGTEREWRELQAQKSQLERIRGLEMKLYDHLR